MSNYEYIIASLPYLTRDFNYSDGVDFDKVVAEIRESLPGKDASKLDFFLKSFQPEVLSPEFYTEALGERNSFLREFFRFDLLLRNAKVRFLNRELGREEDKDVLKGEWGGFEEQAKVESILNGQDLLGREKGLDDLYWEKIDSLSLFHYFDLTAVLAYLAKLHIVDRWFRLDEEKGRELFRKLVDEVRGSFKGVQYTDK